MHSHSRIHLLDPLIANQIAAGEVIERPSSIVKELLENSLDAGATNIEIHLEKGGMQSIRITDNGSGIHPDDLRIALSRHGTSKIHHTEDLEAIHTLGFRGEALASICAITRLSLDSRFITEDQGWKIQAEGLLQENQLAPSAHPPGTTITLRDIFFNTPARRKFLRSEKTEFLHCEEVIRRIALSHFHVRMSLQHNQQLLFTLADAQSEIAQEQRIAKLCGKKFIANAIKIKTELNDLHLWGWMSVGAFSRSQADLQYFYVNGRIVRDKLITHAIRTAYQDLISIQEHPAYILFLEMNPKNVDVNVHPTKHEVRFYESRFIHDFMVRSIRDAMGNPIFTESFAIQKNSQNDFSNLVLTSLSNQYIPELLSAPVEVSEYPLGKPLGQCHDHFILCQNANGILVVNLFAAKKKQIKDQLQFVNEQQPLTGLPLLIPAIVALEPEKIPCVESYFSILKMFGMVLSVMGKETMLVRELPLILQHCEIKDFMQDLTTLLHQKGKDHFPRDEVIHLLANKAAAMVIKPLSISEMEKHLRAIEEDNQLRTDGSLPPFCLTISLRDLSQLGM